MNSYLKKILHYIDKSGELQLQFRSSDGVSDLRYWHGEHTEEHCSAWSYVLPRQFAVIALDGVSILPDLIREIPRSLDMVIHSTFPVLDERLYLGRGGDPVFHTVPGNCIRATVLILPFQSIRASIGSLIDQGTGKALDQLFSGGFSMQLNDPDLMKELHSLHRFRGQSASVNFDYYGRILQILSHIMKLRESHEPMKEKIIGTDEEHLASVEFYIRKNYNKTIRIDDLSRMACMSSSKLKYSFKDRYGTTIISYQQSLRISMAKNLLETTDVPIQEIARRVGYSNPSSFLQSAKRNGR